MKNSQWVLVMKRFGDVGPGGSVSARGPLMSSLDFALCSE